MIKRIIFLLAMLGVTTSLILGSISLIYPLNSTFVIGLLIGAGLLGIPYLPRMLTDPKAIKFWKEMQSRPTWLQLLLMCTNLGMLLLFCLALLVVPLLVNSVIYVFVASLYSFEACFYWAPQHHLKYDIDHLRTR